MNSTIKLVVTWLAGGTGLVILAFAIQFWISLNVKAQLEDAGITPATEIVEMKGDIRGNTEDIVRVESKAERIAQILMED